MTVVVMNNISRQEIIMTIPLRSITLMTKTQPPSTNFIYEVSSPTANYSTIVRCFMIPWGIIMGALGVHIARFVINNMVYYLPSLLVYIIFAIVIVGGPDLLPPLTMINGAEELRERLTWSALFVFIHYSYLLLPDMFKEVYRLPLSSFDVMIIISGICHFDQGDYHFRKFCWCAHCRGEYYRRHPLENYHAICPCIISKLERVLV